jgi:hypothetical protein
VPTCPGNSATEANGLCGLALNSCDVEGDIQFWVYVQTWNEVSGAYGAPVRRPGVECYGADQPGVDPLIAVEAQVRREWRSYPIPAATVTTQPAAGTLAGAVTLFTSDMPAQFALPPRTILGYPVTVSVSASRYVWVFGDGQTASASPGALRTEHVYRTAGPMSVSLRCFYTGTFTIGDSPTVYELDGEADVPGQAQQLPVEQARTQLEAGPTG